VQNFLSYFPISLWTRHFSAVNYLWKGLDGFKTKIHGCSTKRAGRFGYRVRSAVMIYMEPAQTRLPSEQRIDGTWLTPVLAPDKKKIKNSCFNL
jgi:hypothetical protein